MTTGNNKYGAAGRAGVPASTVVAFLDAYTYEGLDRIKRINSTRIPPTIQRSIRRWRNGDVGSVSERGLAHVLGGFGFDRTWFNRWCKLHRKPVK